jgi:HrpA-like RNA helicase
LRSSFLFLFFNLQEEEEEEERRALRIQQLKAIMEAEEAALSPQPSPTAAEVTAAAAAAAAANTADSDGALESSLLSCFPQNGPLGPEETGADDTLLDEKDALEIQDTHTLEAPSDLFPAPAASPSISAENQRLNASLLADWRRTQQSAKYLSILSKRRTLPAMLMREQVMRMVLQRQVVVVSGSTGCGKSTQLPQFILDQAIEAGVGSSCSIICTQPRRLAAIAVAERVAAERAERIGDTVGYSIRLESKRSARTRLLFCTTGIVLRHLESSPTLAGVSHVIVDEVHERGLDSDFLLIILKGLLAKRPDLKLILMSATLNAEIFTKVRCCPGTIFFVFFPLSFYFSLSLSRACSACVLS